MSPATPEDISAIKRIASCVSRRSAAIVSASILALSVLKKEVEEQDASSSSQTPSTAADPSSTSSVSPSSPPSPDNAVVVAYNGSVIERYPSYLENCQAYLNALQAEDDRKEQVHEKRLQPDGELSSISAGRNERGSVIRLVEAKESSLLGAAVALASAG